MKNRSLIIIFVFFAVWSWCLTPASVRAAVSDDFALGSLNPTLWTLGDPLGNASFEIAGGLMTLSVPGGPDNAPGLGGNTSIRMLQNQADTGLYVEVKFESSPTAEGQFQGLVAAEDENHEVRFEYRATAHGLVLTSSVYRNGLTHIHDEVSVAPRDSLFLRMNRWNDLWRLSESIDGQEWTEVTQFTHPIQVATIGLSCGNLGLDRGTTDSDPDNPHVQDKQADRPAVPFDVAIDYFFSVWSPIDPEDGALYDTGERSFDGLQSLYLFRAGGGDKVFDFAPGSVPLNLDLADSNSVAWLPGGGLALNQPTLAVSEGPAAKITTACQASGEVSLEVWVDPSTVDQSGPARILTLSGDPSFRNATLAHGLWGSLPTTVFDARLRTTTTSDNGQPDTYTGEGSLTGDLQHVVFTFDVEGTARIYIDGIEAASQAVGGTLDNWNPDFPLTLGGEVDDSRHWLGSLHLAAVYSRALTPMEIENNHLAGPDGGALPSLAPSVSLEGIQPGDQFDFDQVITLQASAADADGTVARVDFMVGDQVLDSDRAAPFETTWASPPVGSHLVRAVAVDSEGNETFSATTPVLVTTSSTYQSATFLSDDFRGLSLNPYWAVTDLTAGATLSESGGHFHVDLPDGGGDPWDPATPHVFINQLESDVPMALEVKLAPIDFSGDAWGGIHVTDDAGGSFQFIGRRSGGSWTIEWSIANGGLYGPTGSLPLVVTDAGLWLQLRRTGNTWTCLHSTDGLHFTQDANLTGSFAPVRAGWVAGDLPAAGGSTVAVDYAFNLAAPIIPEDGGSGDQTPPTPQEILVEPELDRADLSWRTDEPAHTRLRYGLTPSYELGLQVGEAVKFDHGFEITGLDPGSTYYFEITCIDTAGNVAVTDDEVFYTDIIPVTATGPEGGDVYRESVLVIGENPDDWRVTDPDAANPGAAAFLPNPVLSINLPDLTGAVRAELILDRWGGHPGTSRKRVRFNGASWLHLPEPPIPDASPQCYVYQDNPMIELPLDQLRAGANTLEGTADRQTCSSFDWGQWGWYGAVVRIYYTGETGHPTGSILAPAVGDTLIDLVDVVVDATAPGSVAEVVVLAKYDGYDSDGDGIFNDWHRTYRRDYDGTELRLLDVVGTLDTAPWSVGWDLDWVPEQQPGSVALQARIRGDDGLWYVTEHVTDLSVQHTTGDVHLYALQDVPRAFWVRTTQVKSATFSIPPEHDLALAGSTRLVAHTWNGADAGIIDLNGLWSTGGVGLGHFWERNEKIVPSASLVAGVNTITISAATEHHGMEMLWPGPMVMVRYDAATEAVSTGPDALFAWGDLALVEGQLDLPLILDEGRPTSFEFTVEADDPSILKGLTSPLEDFGSFRWTLEEGRLDIAFEADPGAVLPRELLTIQVIPDPAESRSVTGQATVDGHRSKTLAAAAIPAVPNRYDLKPNRPNPFNPRTRIEFALPASSPVSLAVFDLQGRRIRRLVTETLSYGIHIVDWDGRDDSGRAVASGTYFYRLQAGTYGAVGKMLLVR